MVASNGLGTYGDGAGVVTPTAHKLAHLGLVSKTGAGSNTVRPGLFFDGVTTIVTGAANMSYNVAPFTAVSSRGGSAGAVFFANDGVVNVATTAAPGTDSRIDVVYVWQREFSLDGGTTGPVVGVVQGAVAASPVAPSLAAFPGAVELARVTVPAGVTATNSGATITQTAPFTALEGAVLPVRTSSSLPASAKLGDQAYALDTGVSYEWSGSAWKTIFVPWTAYTPITSNVSGGTVTGAWCRVGDLVQVSIMHTLTGADFTGQPTYSLPVNHVSTSTEWLDGTVLLRDNSAAAELLGVVRKSAATVIAPYCLLASGTYVSFANVNTTTPFTWAIDDTLVMNFSYRAA